GRFRVACLRIASAAVINVWRIHRYLLTKIRPEVEQKAAPSEPRGLPEQAVEAVSAPGDACWTLFDLRSAFISPAKILVFSGHS
ncbi:MAG: hypothetical protein RMK99_07830, partial [Anaerolineales bacterium]|nr:hypothetical protein [Anaerolineales bacterium]